MAMESSSRQRKPSGDETACWRVEVRQMCSEMGSVRTHRCVRTEIKCCTWPGPITHPLNMWACGACRSMDLLAEAPEQEYHRVAAGVALMAFFTLEMCWPEVKVSVE